MRRLQRIFGRNDNMVKLRGVNVFPEAVGATVVADPRSNGEFFCIVERRGEAGIDEMTVLVEARDTATDRAGLGADLERRLNEVLGVRVTDMARRHPASLAQSALTLDHLTGGRFVLGVGTGEALNLTPFGLPNDRPLSRLDEGLHILRLLMAGSGEIDFAGDHFRLEGASMGLGPFGDAPPPVWVAAHRPRGLELVGRRADGWLPFATDPDAYAEKIDAYVDAGYTHVYLHQVGADQEGFLDFCASEILPRYQRVAAPAR